MWKAAFAIVMLQTHFFGFPNLFEGFRCQKIFPGVMTSDV